MVYPRFASAHCSLFLTFVAGTAAAFAMAAASTSAQTEAPRIVEITARRFAFAPAEIQAAVGERLQLVIRSADGVHGLEIKKFKVKKEIPRGGSAAVVEFTVTEAGRFPILCSEYCGDGHERMTGTLVVVARAEDPSGDNDTPEPTH